MTVTSRPVLTAAAALASLGATLCCSDRHEPGSTVGSTMLLLSREKGDTRTKPNRLTKKRAPKQRVDTAISTRIGHTLYRRMGVVSWVLLCSSLEWPPVASAREPTPSTPQEDGKTHMKAKPSTEVSLPHTQDAVC